MVAHNAVKSSTSDYGNSYGNAAETNKRNTDNLLPSKLLCRDCHKWKSASQFSKKQLSTLQRRAATSGPGMRPKCTTGALRCRGCVGEQIMELECNGPCGLYKSLEEFSKSQRTRPTVAWCIVCTQWKEAAEPGVTPMAPPNSVLAPDEELALIREENDGVAASMYRTYNVDIEGGADSDDEIPPDSFLFNPMTSMSITGEQVTKTSKGETSLKRAALETVLNSGLPTRSNTPGSARYTHTGQSISSLSNPYSSANNEEWRQFATAETKNQIPVSNAPSTDNASNGGWFVVDAKRKHAGTAPAASSYNVWDPLGNLYQRQRQPSTSTTASYGNLASIQDQDTGSSIDGGHSGWAKSTGRKAPLPQFPTIERPQNRRLYCDDESDPDEM